MDSDLQKPRPGDMIEISRPGYEHWALYVGNGYVIHLTAHSKAVSGGGNISSMPPGKGKAVVKKELLHVVAGTDQYKVNNKHDHKYGPLPVQEIVQSAEKLVGTVTDYSLTRWNCEHFVNLLHYGVLCSDQADMLEAGGVLGAGMLLMGLIGIILSRS